MGRHPLKFPPMFLILLSEGLVHFLPDGHHLGLVASDLLGELSYDGFVSVGVGCVLVGKHPLGPERGGRVPHDPSNYIVCRLGGVVVTNKLCTFVEDRFEKVGDELVLACFSDILRDFPPHVGYEHDVLECRFST